MPPVFFVYEHKKRFAGRFIFYDEIRINSAVRPYLPGIEKCNLKVSLERLFQPNDRVQPAPDLCQFRLLSILLPSIFPLRSAETSFDP